jgi:hypothetical protein
VSVGRSVADHAPAAERHMAGACDHARAPRRADAGDDRAQRQRSEGGAEEAPTATNAPVKSAARLAPIGQTLGIERS